jgi:hypothetical protein
VHFCSVSEAQSNLGVLEIIGTAVNF